MKTIQTRLVIKTKKQYCDGLFRLECESKTELPHIAPGQFAHLKVPGKQLRRPICVYKNTSQSVTFIIANVGEGTAALTAQSIGAEIDALLPLGNGYPVLPDITGITLLGGGTGCAPLLKIAADNPSLNCTALLGFRTASEREVFEDDFDKACKKVCYCTDDGSFGYHGYPTDLITEVAPEVLYVCGAMGMVKTAKEYCRKLGVIGFASMEQRMGCGVGACLVCSVPIIKDGVQKMMRACKDGPVFALEDIVV